MSQWPARSLEELVERDRPITYGVVKPGDHDPDGVKFIRGGDIFDGRLLAEQLRTISRDVSAQYRRTLLRGGEVVVSLVGNPGHVAVVPEALAGANLARQAGLVAVDRAVADPDFIKYFLMSPTGRAGLIAQTTGSVQVVINLAELRRVRVPVPPLPVQRRIAAILSAYDDLIENCERRIRVLDEMARALYREWFVDFRYPGHEKVPLVDSPMGRIPKGWTLDRLERVARVHRGRSYRSADLADEGGVPFVNLKCIDRDGGFRRSGIKRFVGAAPETHAVRPADIVVAVTDMTQERRIVARAALVPTLDAEFGVLSMDLVRLEAVGVPSRWLYSLLRYSSFADHLKQHANGANVLHLSPDRIREHVVSIPPVGLLDRFAALVSPMFVLHDALENRVANLRRTRDLLLPRLLSGQLSVEAVE